MDFGLTKKTIKDLVDSFDHAESIWDKDFLAVEQAECFSERYIIMPITPSAEQYSLIFLYMIDKIISATSFNNGERGVKVHSVIVHETDTGYAQSFRDDLRMVTYNLSDIKFSEGVMNEWSDPKMFSKLIEATAEGTTCFTNSKVEQQVT